MGNVGSLFLGASLGFVSLITKTEILLILIGMIFVIEALSVIIQVIYFQTTGKRIFKMSPIHHHFELSGWSESQVTTRFWILTLFFGIIGWLFFKK
jgi:phospho-N-acetylmuramoyl-pentapeptide-transferase